MEPLMPVILGGAFPLSTTPKGEKGGIYLMEITPRVKTVSNLPLGFPEYEMTNASNFRWGFPLPLFASFQK